jgi:tetratricopeptide (TPR) repeat protein
MTTVLTVCLQIALAAASGAQNLAAWNSQDIGETRIRGQATLDKKEMTWTVKSDGRDIFDFADSFHYVYQPFKGNGWISAKVENISESHPWAKVGVMIRETLGPGSRCAIVYATPLNGVSAQVRTTTGGTTFSDNHNRTQEQTAMKVPIWIKLERSGNSFRAYFATDDSNQDWRPVTWKPAPIAMSKVTYIGLAVASHEPGVICQARYSNVTIHQAMEGDITDLEILQDPIQSRRKAYDNLEGLGNWRKNAKTMRNHGNLIATSLFAIGRATELTREPQDEVLSNYYRVVELFPESSRAVQALIRIAILDGMTGLQYGAKHLKEKPREDQDMFYLGVLEGHLDMPETPERQASIRLFMQHVEGTSNFRLIKRAINAIRASKHAPSIYKSLIEYGMAQPSNEQMAITALKYIALELRGKEGDNLIHELANWTATQFKDTKLTICAMAILADTHYTQGHYVEAIEVFQPELFSKSQTESKTVENIENTLIYYRANTLLHGTFDQERIYQGLADKASGLGLNIVALHCQRKVAAIEGLSMERFEKSAQKGIKYSESDPENEVWFWRGLVAAEGGDLGKAAAAYERFIQDDDRSVLAARAYYDIARAKMALGEDAKVWIAKSKALSPCDAVIQLERRLVATVSPQS